MQRLRNKEEGAVAVELAIVIPVIAALLFGMVELGVSLVREEKYVNAARDGARYAAIHCPPAATCSSALIQARVANALGCSSNCWVSAPSANRDCTQSGSVGQPVTVSFTEQIVIDTPFFKITRTPTIKASFSCEG